MRFTVTYQDVVNLDHEGSAWMYNAYPFFALYWLTKIVSGEDSDETLITPHTPLIYASPRRNQQTGSIIQTHVYVQSAREYACFGGLFIRAIIRFRVKKKLKMANEVTAVVKSTDLLCDDLTNVIKQYVY